MPAQIPRILYHRPSLNTLILSLNKYSKSRIILENPLHNHRQIYFPELLKPPLDNINLLCYNIAREPVWLSPIDIELNSGPKGQYI